MTYTTAIHPTPRAVTTKVWPRDLAWAFGIVTFIFLTYAMAGFPTLSAPGGDNDSMLRLVEVRDLLGGQGWFDLSQYRMGPAGGFVMHWSRLIDAPIAAIVLVAGALGASQPLAEMIAVTLWPALMMVATLFGLMQLARAVGNEYAILPATALGAGALFFIGIYRPMSIDHHNAQIALTVAMLVFLVAAPRHKWFSALAGICAAVMLAIGMETAPYVAIGGAAVALLYLIRGQHEAARTAEFGLAFAAGTFFAFIATVGPSQWSVPYCDALSNVQLSLASAGGLGLAAVALMPTVGNTFTRRLIGLGVLAIGFAALARLGFPQCLADPYAGVDQRLRDVWLDYVAEAQSVVQLAKGDWTKLLMYYATPILGILVLAGIMRRDGARRETLIYGGFLVAAVAVCAWQLRGSSFSIPLATTALALGVANLREKAQKHPSAAASIALLAGWLLSFNIVWSLMGGLFKTPAPDAEEWAADDLACTAVSSFARLAELPAGTVLAVSDLGSAILMNTPHRVLSGPYHRNIAGNLAMIDAMLGSAEKARDVVDRQNVDYVAICKGNPESTNFKEMEPNGLMANLLDRKIPAWLSQLPETEGKPIQIYRVVREN